MTYLKHQKNRKKDLLTIMKKIGYKKIVIYSMAVLFFLTFLYYLLSFLFISSFDICLEKLKKSYNDEVICREECYLNREEYYNCLSKKLDKNLDKIEKIIKDEDENIDFRLDLISFLSSVYGKNNVPVFLNEYLTENGVNSEIQTKIIYSYDFSNGLDSYFQILEGNFSLEMKKAAIYKISNYENKEEYNNDQLFVIKDLIFKENIEKDLRQDLVLLLANYQEQYREDVLSIWEDVYTSSFDGDDISRAFAADFLGKEDVVVEESEWLKYFSN